LKHNYVLIFVISLRLVWHIKNLFGKFSEVTLELGKRSDPYAATYFSNPLLAFLQ